MDLVLKNAMVVDVKNDVYGRRDIGVDGGQIAAVGETLPAGKETVDLEGRTLLPGIIDMHVHVTNLLGGPAGYYMVAKTGVTTIIDFAGPVSEILQSLPLSGCGLNVGCLDGMISQQYGNDPKPGEAQAYLEACLADGALGLKILGGHFPLTPDATAACIEAANRRRAMVAFHAGTTRCRSDILGMREAIELAGGSRLLLAHINAYCRGKHYPYLEELRDAFTLLRENPNILADSHMSIQNGTVGLCANGVPADEVTVNCLRMFGYAPTEEGLGRAIREGLAKVIVPGKKENTLLEGEAAFRLWQQHGTRLPVSFPANLASVAVACMTERSAPNGGFLIDLAATDGGGFPRNDLPGRLLALHRLGYLTLPDIVRKASLNPARAFGLAGKGHLGVGACADITVLNHALTGAEMSFARGLPVLRAGGVVGSGGCLLTTREGAAAAQRQKLAYELAEVARGSLYS